MTDSIIKIQSLFKGYSFRKRILIPPSSYQTKLWRQNQKWYRGGKHNECELYQRDLIEKITKLPCNKSDKRFNIYNKLLIDNKYPMKNKDGFEWTEDFDGHTVYDDKINNRIVNYYFNLKIICDAGGAQTRSLREVYHFISVQLEHCILFPDDSIYFINILDGNTCYKHMDKFNYLLNKPQYCFVRHRIFVGDMNSFQEFWLKKK